jgi:hypothetical protein
VKINPAMPIISLRLFGFNNIEHHVYRVTGGFWTTGNDIGSDVVGL